MPRLVNSWRTPAWVVASKRKISSSRLPAKSWVRVPAKVYFTFQLNCGVPLDFEFGSSLMELIFFWLTSPKAVPATILLFTQLYPPPNRTKPSKPDSLGIGSKAATGLQNNATMIPVTINWTNTNFFITLSPLVRLVAISVITLIPVYQTFFVGVHGFNGYHFST